MDKVIEFLSRQQRQANAETQELVEKTGKLLAEYPMRSIILALFQNATDGDDIAVLTPSLSFIIKTVDNPEK